MKVSLLTCIPSSTGGEVQFNAVPFNQSDWVWVNYLLSNVGKRLPFLKDEEYPTLQTDIKKFAIAY